MIIIDIDIAISKTDIIFEIDIAYASNLAHAWIALNLVLVKFFKQQSMNVTRVLAKILLLYPPLIQLQSIGC
jgi:hypothetical protein